MINYLRYQWLLIDEETITIGLNSEGLDEFMDIDQINLPDPEEIVLPNEPCGEIHHSEGTLSIYSPVDGQVLEINEALIEQPELLQEDNYGDGWLIKIESSEPIDVEEIKRASREDL
ncbi:MAG: glycine cleavage system protein H [Bdellovibrionaceae bacterium]|nr:glycine cleavage system protein H [Pseudobdellovibrionaceae bacterium]|tara:strand:- start:109 stop:459 length:351 start_codon:yes stop_codon:yes gene_type:complete